MPLTTTTLDIAAARRTVQQHVVESAEVIVCWQRPEGIYRIHKSGDDSNFYFAVVEPFPMQVGGTWHIAVDRRNGVVSELGKLGE